MIIRPISSILYLYSDKRGHPQKALWVAEVPQGIRELAEASGLIHPIFWDIQARSANRRGLIRKAASLIGPICIGLDKLGEIGPDDSVEAVDQYHEFLTFVRVYLSALMTYPNAYPYSRGR